MNLPGSGIRGPGSASEEREGTEVHGDRSRRPGPASRTQEPDLIADANGSLIPTGSRIPNPDTRLSSYNCDMLDVLLSEPVVDPIASGHLIQTSPKRRCSGKRLRTCRICGGQPMFECAESPRAAANRHSHEEI